MVSTGCRGSRQNVCRLTTTSPGTTSRPGSKGPVGYGHLIARDEWDLYKDGITDAQAEDLFAEDLAPFVDAVNSGLPDGIEQHEFDACVALAFNIGASGFSSSSALKLINNPNAQTNYDDLESAWRAWNKSDGKFMQGLANRRNAEWNIYSQAVYERW